MNIKQLNKVIKIIGRQIKDLKLTQSSLAEEINQLDNQLNVIEAEKSQELSLLNTAEFFYESYKGYFLKQNLEVTKINDNIAYLQIEMAKINEKIIELFKEQRKYEILIDKYNLKQLETEKKQEIKMFDEINIFKHNSDR